MTDAETPTCSARIFSPHFGHVKICSRAGKVVRDDDRWYCRFHSPAATAERRAKRDAKDEARILDWAEQSRLAILRAEMLDACKKFVDATAAWSARDFEQRDEAEKLRKKYREVW